MGLTKTGGSTVSSIERPQNAGGLELLDRAFHIERIAIAMIGTDDRRQLAGAVDAQHLGDEFRQWEHNDVRRAEDREVSDATEPENIPISSPRSPAGRAIVGS